MNDILYPIAAIGVVAIVTWGLRAFPFLLFGSRPLPKTVENLGKALPPAIMTILVIYCMKDTVFVKYPFAIPEVSAGVLVAVLQIAKKNMYLSIIAGTVIYMILIRII